MSVLAAEDWLLDRYLTSRVMVVGELNPYGANPRLALYPKPARVSGDRLRRVMGVDRTTYLSFARANLCDGRWNRCAAEAKAEALMNLAHHQKNWEPRCLILLGAKVRDVCCGPSLMTFRTSGIVAIVSLPHPSGRCRDWNDPCVTEIARGLLRGERVAPWVPWGSCCE